MKTKAYSKSKKAAHGGATKALKDNKPVVIMRQGRIADISFQTPLAPFSFEDEGSHPSIHEAYTGETRPPFSVYFHNSEPPVKLLKGDCIETLNLAHENSVDMIFADPPYFLSNGGVTCHAGKMVSVDKGEWDKSKGVKENHEFNLKWLTACQRVLKPNGTIWVSGTNHVIHTIGFAMQELGFKILNDIVWFKPNAAPNLSCRYFTHSTEFILWAAKNKKSKHQFDYALMKKLNEGKQMRNVWGFWEINTPPKDEKKFGKHPTQKPLELLKRVILASTKEGDLVLDPFCGSSTTGVAAILLKRRYVGIEVEDEYLELSQKRLEVAISSLSAKRVPVYA